MAKITVDGANDLPPPNTKTSISVTGEDFPPSSEVRIRISHPAIHDTAQVDEAGRFGWERTVSPRLADGASIEAKVTASDGSEVEGTGDVVGVGGAGADAPT